MLALSLSARFHHPILRGFAAKSASAVAKRFPCPANAVRATFCQLQECPDWRWQEGRSCCHARTPDPKPVGKVVFSATTGGRRLRYRVPAEQKRRNVKAASTRPVAPPPPAAAQAAAPNRPQNAGTKNPIQSVLTKNQLILDSRLDANNLPTSSACSECTVTAFGENRSRRACSRSFTWRPARCGSRGRLTRCSDRCRRSKASSQRHLPDDQPTNSYPANAGEQHYIELSFEPKSIYYHFYQI